MMIFKPFPSNKSCEIEKAENGWICRIRKPLTTPTFLEGSQKQQMKVIGKIIALLSKLSASEAAKGVDEELEPWKEPALDTADIMKEIDRIIDEAFEKEPPPLIPDTKTVSTPFPKLEKEEATYIFSNIEEALNFLRRFLESPE